MTSNPEADEVATAAAADAADEASGAPDGAAAPPSMPDDRLLAAHDLALSALAEITPPATIGEPAGYSAEPDGVVSLRFATTMPGYPGWFWTVSLARVDDAEPTVLEVELLPGDGALLAPDWVPWAVRLAEYQAQQAATAPSRPTGDMADDDAADVELDDVDDLDAADFDDDGSSLLHSGDVDGVDIDELDVDAADALPGEDDQPEDDEPAHGDQPEDDLPEDDDPGYGDLPEDDEPPRGISIPA